jgi:uncharacterized membrane protein YdjX (TVP38/TMEM64 family)
MINNRVGVSPPRRAGRLARWLALAAVGTVVLLGPLVFAEQIEALASAAVETARDRPLLVAAMIVMALALDVFLPVPNGVTNTLAGAIFGFAGGAMVIWTGLMAASLLGYGVGALAARPLARRLLGEEELARAHRFAEGLGPLVLILSRPVPIFAELAALAAGMAAMPLRLFLALTALANLVIALVYAGIGSAAMTSGSGSLAMVGGVGLPLAAWLAYRWWDRRKDN